MSVAARVSAIGHLVLEANTPDLTTCAGAFQVLHTFKGGHDGVDPDGELILDGGVLYGTTYRDGDRNDAGTVYKVTPTGRYSIIHRFVRHALFLWACHVSAISGYQ